MALLFPLPDLPEVRGGTVVVPSGTWEDALSVDTPLPPVRVLSLYGPKLGVRTVKGRPTGTYVMNW